jgi:hypothetical protein
MCPNPLSEELNEGWRKKKPRIDTRIRCDSPINLEGFRQQDFLGDELMGVVKFMGNGGGEPCAVKHFLRT